MKGNRTNIALWLVFAGLGGATSLWALTRDAEWKAEHWYWKPAAMAFVAVVGYALGSLVAPGGGRRA